MLIKKHETYEFEETTSRNDVPSHRVSAIRTRHHLEDTNKHVVDQGDTTTLTSSDGKDTYSITYPTFDREDLPSQASGSTITTENKPEVYLGEQNNVVDKYKVYEPSKDSNMDLDELIQQSTGKKYSSSWFYGDSSKNPYPTIEEQVKLCRKIASQLVDDENKKSKGASMFFKRLKRSQKWIHEGQGKKEPVSENEVKEAEARVQKMKQDLKSETIPRLKLILDPRELLSLEKLRKMGDIVEHNIVSPDICHNLVKDLNSPEANKGAQIFLKRKEKSEEWVVDENSCCAQLREIKREKEQKAQKENAQKEWLARKQREKIVELQQLENIKEAIPKINIVKSPWEASLEGGVDKAFEITLPAIKKPEIYKQDKKTSLSNNSITSCKNYKNFNRNPRGWGMPLENYDCQSNTYAPSISPRSSILSPLLNPEYDIPQSYRVLEELKPTLNMKSSDYYNAYKFPLVEKQTHSILKKPNRLNNLHKSATVNFQLENEKPPEVHFDLQAMNPKSLNFPKFKNFNSVPKKWNSHELGSFL